MMKNVWGTIKEVVRGKFRPTSRKKKSQINSLTPKVTRKRVKPGVSRKKYIIEIRAEINEIKT